MFLCLIIEQVCNFLNNNNRLRLTTLLFIQGGLNLSLPQQLQSQPPDNHTVQSFLKAYVDNYMGWCNVFFVLIVE